jgi:inosine-uridine nucleoside N-ribohydrolase
VKVSPSHKVLVLVDNVDPDNLACVLAATNPLFGLEVVGVMVSGRPAVRGRDAGTDESAMLESRRVRRNNTRRMREFLDMAGRRTVPVFEGLIAPHTLVPHRIHIDESVLVAERDRLFAGVRVDGNFIDPYELLLSLDGPIHVIVGGPFTELAALTEDPEIVSRLGIVTAQLGMFGFGDVKTMGGGRRQFNAACDPEAVHRVLSSYPGHVYMAPTDITKMPTTGFDNPDELARHHMNRELVEVYRRAFPLMLEPRGERIYLHDVHPVFMLAQLLGSGPEIYDIEPVTVSHVPHADEERERWGEIDVEIGRPSAFGRYVATGLDGGQYLSSLYRTVGNGRSAGEHYLIYTDREGYEHPGMQSPGRYLDGTLIDEVCARCGWHDCSAHELGWRHLCQREHAAEPVRGYDVTRAADEGWAFRFVDGHWLPASDYTPYHLNCC